MPPRTDFLTKQRQQIEARLRELQPAHEEYLTLLQARDALAGVKPANGRRGPGRPPGKRGPGRPPGSGSKTAASRKKTTRRRRGGTRAEQALALIQQNPGITVADIADRMGIRQNYLYRVTQELQKDRKVSRRGGGFHAK
jgi:winged helix-turn-helix DNA-binding protein